jgi:hypothetical protein
MKKWLKIAIPIVVIIAIIVFYIIFNIMSKGFIDGGASFGVLRSEQTSQNEITFTIDGDVNDWYSDPVKFSDCAFSLMVDNKTLSSDDYTFREFNNDRWIDMEYSKVHGPGTLNATLCVDSDNFFVVIVNDLDKDEQLSTGDKIIVNSMDPLQSYVEYRIFLATDIQGGNGHANYIGTLNGPQRSGW